MSRGRTNKDIFKTGHIYVSFLTIISKDIEKYCKALDTVLNVKNNLVESVMMKTISFYIAKIMTLKKTFINYYFTENMIIKRIFKY